MLGRGPKYGYSQLGYALSVKRFARKLIIKDILLCHANQGMNGSLLEYYMSNILPMPFLKLSEALMSSGIGLTPLVRKARRDMVLLSQATQIQQPTWKCCIWVLIYLMNYWKP